MIYEDKLNDYLDKDGKFEKCELEEGGTYFGYSYEYEVFNDGKAIFAYMEYLEEEKDFERSGYFAGYDVDTKKGEELEDEEDWEED